MSTYKTSVGWADFHKAAEQEVWFGKTLAGRSLLHCHHDSAHTQNLESIYVQPDLTQIWIPGKLECITSSRKFKRNFVAEAFIGLVLTKPNHAFFYDAF